MEKSVYALFNKVRQNWCDTCDGGDCKNCVVSELLNDIKYLDIGVAETNEGCFICEDKYGKQKTVFYDDGRGGLRTSSFCPNCRRKLEKLQ